MIHYLKPKFSRLHQYLRNNSELLIYFSWIISISATLGSLFFSEVLKLPPCKLCWFQRIFIYPLVFMYLVSLLIKDRRIVLYTLPLSTMGLVIAFYHTLIYEGIIPEPPTFCEVGVSCTTKLVEVFGFLSIPALSLIAFLLIFFVNFYYLKIHQKEIFESFK